jgi:hypothetical protein
MFIYMILFGIQHTSTRNIFFDYTWFAGIYLLVVPTHGIDSMNDNSSCLIHYSSICSNYGIESYL